MEPTAEQLKAFFDFCVRASELLQTIELTRYDKRNNRIAILVGQTIEVEILSSGEVLIR
ncbi:MAG: hypothetical protein RMX96_26425 [Nostoc sp. ChiSLP02]|nr:hypothetical protein [Nostoc sp. DedSLP05]MDZ8100374.1 hypothetical protein [Nostoc sp. DedSLP01]MDZ8188380.1 hypothetical protein [Nostoc sp. ChiSLP02]